MKRYHGYRQITRAWDGTATTSKCVVQVSFTATLRWRPLRPRNDIRDHSPDGFEWGYGGSGPAQLALALVADCCGRSMAVPSIYQRVKATLVSKLPADGWTLTEDEIRAAVESAEAERDAKWSAIDAAETPEGGVA